MNYYGSPQLIGAFMMFFIAILIFVYNKKNTINITFSLFCVSVSIYLFGMFMIYQSKSPGQGLFWQRVIHVGLSFMPVLLYHCYSSFYHKRQPYVNTPLPEQTLSRGF